MSKTFLALAVLSLAQLNVGPTWAAKNLQLRDGLTFESDSENAFPIIADQLDDHHIDAGSPAFLFFGAAGDMNTNRQAKRLVDLYKHFKEYDVKFIVVDVDRPADDQGKQLLRQYYQGYVPEQVLIGPTGAVTWRHQGELENKIIAQEISSVASKKKGKAN